MVVFSKPSRSSTTENMILKVGEIVAKLQRDLKLFPGKIRRIEPGYPVLRRTTKTMQVASGVDGREVT